MQYNIIYKYNQITNTNGNIKTQQAKQNNTTHKTQISKQTYIDNNICKETQTN